MMLTTPDVVTALSDEAQLNTIFARSPVGICIARNTIILNANAALLAMFGYEDVAQIRGRSLVDLVAPSARAALTERAQRRERGEIVPNVYEIIGMRQNGSTFPYIVAVDTIQLADGIASVAFCTDISDRKRAEDRLRFLAESSIVLASSLNYHETIRNVTTIIVPSLADWCTVDMRTPDGGSERVAVFHADPLKQHVLERIRTNYTLPPNAAMGYPAVIRTGRSILVPLVTLSELRQVALDQEHLELLVSLGVYSMVFVPISARGVTIGALTLGLSELRASYTSEDLAFAEELGRRVGQAVDNGRLYQEAQDAIALRDQFLMLAAHELRTPITSLMGYAQWLVRQQQAAEYMPTERERRATETIAFQAERLKLLVNTLLDVSRVEQGRLMVERTPLDLCALLRRMVDDVQTILHIHTVVGDLPANPVIVLGDVLRLEQVLQNLMQNAIKYSPRGGEVRVRLEATSTHARVAVTDQGIGIPEVAQERLFTRFFRAPNVADIGGLGLGLQLAKELIELHDGTIEVVSSEGQGSTFTVRLPLYSPPIEE
ncbi:MAG: PAS domain-containing sensor histidine kinase [Roseiflexaceae bacterium]|nr:PAS domain-containing sensor histidine kinase [Roseiflexaceae bacterium]